MNTFPNASVSRSLQQNYHQELSPAAPSMEQEGEGALSLEWLSIFIEDCFSGTTTFSIPQNQTSPTNNPPLSQPPNTKPMFNHMNKFPTKTKFKRRKVTLMEEEIIPLLPQTYWLAESELLFPKKDCEEEERAKNMEEVQGQARRCAHCQSQKTPQWRAGPLGPKTLCNACGVRFKSGRLLPEYRPAKSPTFVSYKHSNSHKKVMEMRMSIKM